VSVSTLPAPKPGNPAGRLGLKRKEAALERLGVTPAQLAAASDITSVLKDIPKGRMIAFKAMRFSSSPAIKTFLKRYGKVPEGDRPYLSIEAISIAADIEPTYLLGEIMLAMREHSVTKYKLRAIVGHPEIIESRLKFAKGEHGYRDRDAVDIMMGALPGRQGGSTFINKFFAGKSGDEPGEPEQPERFEDDLDVIFPDVSIMQEKVQPMRQKLLETRK
jgi:hypothetical protein